MNSYLKAGMATALAIATATPALAQYRPTDQYQREYNEYQRDSARYDDQRAAYEAARRDYERRRQDWIVARDRYDRRYGTGAYVRVYGPEPIWDSNRWAAYDARGADRYGRNSSYVDCRRGNSGAIAGGLIGALAGAALGSNVAANGRGTEGSVLGAVVGGAIGAGVGQASDRAKCDRRGVYYSYNDTLPYRESAYDRARASGRYNYSYYSRQRCRLAPAPIDEYGQDYRYVRVCPDRDGRYRITG